MPGSHPEDNETVTALKEFSCDVETMKSQYEECDMKEVSCVGLQSRGTALWEGRLWAWLREGFSESLTSRTPEGRVGERRICVCVCEHACTCYLCVCMCVLACVNKDCFRWREDHVHKT